MSRKNVSGDKLFLAAWVGNVEKVNALIKAGEKVNAKDGKDKTPLMYAAEEGHSATVEALLKAGANVNAKDGKGNTALIYAAKGHHTRTIAELFKASPDVNIKNDSGKTMFDLLFTKSTPLSPARLEAERAETAPLKSQLAKSFWMPFNGRSKLSRTPYRPRHGGSYKKKIHRKGVMTMRRRRGGSRRS